MPALVEQMSEMNYPERAAFILGKYLADELGADFLKEICEKVIFNTNGFFFSPKES